MLPQHLRPAPYDAMRVMYLDHLEVGACVLVLARIGYRVVPRPPLDAMRVMHLDHLEVGACVIARVRIEGCASCCALCLVRCTHVWYRRLV